MTRNALLVTTLLLSGCDFAGAWNERFCGDGGCDAGEVDAGEPVDAGADGGVDAGFDAGPDAGHLDGGNADGGTGDGGDGGVDAGVDGGADAGAADAGPARDAGLPCPGAAVTVALIGSAPSNACVAVGLTLLCSSGLPSLPVATPVSLSSDLPKSTFSQFYSDSNCQQPLAGNTFMANAGSSAWQVYFSSRSTSPPVEYMFGEVKITASVGSVPPTTGPLTLTAELYFQSTDAGLPVSDNVACGALTQPVLPPLLTIVPGRPDLVARSANPSLSFSLVPASSLQLCAVPITPPLVQQNDFHVTNLPSLGLSSTPVSTPPQLSVVAPSLGGLQNQTIAVCLDALVPTTKPNWCCSGQAVAGVCL